MSGDRNPSHRDQAVMRRGPLDRPLARVSRTVSVIDGRGAVGTRSVSLAGLAGLGDVTSDDVDPRGTWGLPPRPSDQIDVTAALLGDPGPGRSALDMRGRG